MSIKPHQISSSLDYRFYIDAWQKRAANTQMNKWVIGARLRQSLNVVCNGVRHPSNKRNYDD